MRQVALRDFRIRGEKALTAVPKGKVVVLCGRADRFTISFLSRATLDSATRNCAAMVMISMQKSWREAVHRSLDQLSKTQSMKKFNVRRKDNRKLVD